MRISLSVIIVGFTLAAETGVALAHAYPVQETPRAGAVQKVTPSVVSITFTENVNAHFSGIVVTSLKGVRVDSGNVVREPENHKILSVTINDILTAGTYKVTWHALSTDGHRTQGSYEFSEAP